MSQNVRVLLVAFELIEVYGEFIFGLLGPLTFLSWHFLRLATSAENRANRRWWRLSNSNYVSRQRSLAKCSKTHSNCRNGPVAAVGGATGGVWQLAVQKAAME